MILHADTRDAPVPEAFRSVVVVQIHVVISSQSLRSAESASTIWGGDKEQGGASGKERGFCGFRVADGGKEEGARASGRRMEEANDVMKIARRKMFDTGIRERWKRFGKEVLEDGAGLEKHGSKKGWCSSLILLTNFHFVRDLIQHTDDSSPRWPELKLVGLASQRRAPGSGDRGRMHDWASCPRVFANLLGLVVAARHRRVRFRKKHAVGFKSRTSSAVCAGGNHRDAAALMHQPAAKYCALYRVVGDHVIA